VTESDGEPAATESALSESASSERAADTYAAHEREAMVRYQGVKQRVLSPLLRAMESMGLQPWMVTGASLVTGFAFCPLFLISGDGWALNCAYLMLLLHLLLDGLDGPLARHLGLASKRGSFVDTVADQLVVAAICATMIAAKQKGFAGVSIFAGSTHLFLYTAVVVFAVVRNTAGISYRFVVRPRNFVYAWLFFESYFFVGTPLENSIEWGVWGFNMLLAAQFVTGYVAIRNYIGQKYDDQPPWQTK